MRLAIVGSRGYPDEEQVRAFVHALTPDTIIVSGGAAGVDSWAADQARKDGLQVEAFLPDYELFGNHAPLVRNSKIAAAADEMIAFWDGESRGTKDAITKMLNAGKSVTVRVKRTK